VVTAEHVVQNPNPLSRYFFTPGTPLNLEKDASWTEGHVLASGSARKFAISKKLVLTTPSKDWAVVKLGAGLGQKFGTLAVIPWSSQSKIPEHVIFAGYPGACYQGPVANLIAISAFRSHSPMLFIMNLLMRDTG